LLRVKTVPESDVILTLTDVTGYLGYLKMEGLIYLETDIFEVSSVFTYTLLIIIVRCASNNEVDDERLSPCNRQTNSIISKSIIALNADFEAL